MRALIQSGHFTGWGSEGVKKDLIGISINILP